MGVAQGMPIPFAIICCQKIKRVYPPEAYTSDDNPIRFEDFFHIEPTLRNI